MFLFGYDEAGSPMSPEKVRGETLLSVVLHGLNTLCYIRCWIMAHFLSESYLFTYVTCFGVCVCGGTGV